MKLVLRVIFWLALSFLSFCALGLLFSNLTVVFVPVAILMAALLIRQLCRLRRQKQAGDTAGANKTRRQLALIAALPVALVLVITVWMFLSLSRMIG